MQNPRQPTSRVDLKLISDSRQIFDKTYARSDVTEKMTTLTYRLEKEACTAIKNIEKSNRTYQKQTGFISSTTGLNTSESRSGSAAHPIEVENHGQANKRKSASNPSEGSCIRRCCIADQMDVDTDNNTPSQPHYSSHSNRHVQSISRSSPAAFDWSGWNHDMTNSSNSNNGAALNSSFGGGAATTAGGFYDMMSDIQAKQHNTALSFSSSENWHGAGGREGGTEFHEPSNTISMNNHNILYGGGSVGHNRPQQQGSHQYKDGPDLWQAPVNFEWDQWAAFVSRFPGEQLMDVQSTL